MNSELTFLIKQYNLSVSLNDEAMKNLAEIKKNINSYNKISVEDKLKKKIKLLDLRTKVINLQIEKRLKEL